MKIAVVGSGIAGLGAALALSRDHEVSVFEKDMRFGGHAHTQDVDIGGQSVSVDTGFIVYNTVNYPNLTSLFEYLDVPTKWSDMSFGVSVSRGHLEYACESVDKLFAQRRNSIRPSYWRLLSDIRRFNQTSASQMLAGALAGLTLKDYIARERYSTVFRDWFVLPMGGAIWSTPTARIMDFPADRFVSFFHNHDLMTGLARARRWRTVDGGSRAYVSRLLAAFRGRAAGGAEVVEVARGLGQPQITFADGSRAAFDQVILAGHAPQSRAVMRELAADERGILSRFETVRNEAVLHSDSALMPRRRKVWSSWNFLSDGQAGHDRRPAPVTYWMNRLQGLTTQKPLFVSLNPRHEPDPDLVWGRFAYDHPVFGEDAFGAQRDLDSIQGRGGVWYAGAWTGYGFHEDGLRSGLRVAQALGSRPEWMGQAPEPFGNALSQAAE